MSFMLGNMSELFLDEPREAIHENKSYSNSTPREIQCQSLSPLMNPIIRNEIDLIPNEDLYLV